MGKLQRVPIDLSGGVTCDADEINLGLVYTENLIKPAGGMPEGLVVRPGLKYFDTIARSGNSGSQAVLCVLPTNEGYPEGSFIALIQSNVSGGIEAPILALNALSAVRSPTGGGGGGGDPTGGGNFDDDTLDDGNEYN